MSIRMNDIFKLPEKTLAGDRRIPKTKLVEQAALTKHEQKVLDKVKRLEHCATVQKSTTKMLPRVDDEHDIQGIIFLRCEMAGTSEAYAEVGRLLHKCFPNPTVILFDGGASCCMSASVTRKSYAERGATVIELIESSGAFGRDDRGYAGFLDALAFAKLSQEDLLRYLEAIVWNIRLSRTVPALGFFPSCPEVSRQRLIEAVGRHDSLRVSIKDIEEKRREKDISLNDAAKLRMELKKIKKECDSVAQEIKEICNG